MMFLHNAYPERSKRLKDALRIFISLYPHHIKDFKIQNNNIFLVVGDRELISYDFEAFYKRKVFPMWADIPLDDPLI